MQKTGNEVTIPVMPELESILKKYETNDGYNFPKAISDQKANEYIKKIAKKIDLLKIEVIINSTEDGLRVPKPIPKYELISNHTARRSFATNAALRGIPYQYIMPITGHKSEKSFLRYIKIDGHNSAKMFKLAMKNTEKKLRAI